MSSNNETLIICPENDEGTNLVDSFAIAVGSLTLVGSVITYFIQRNQERNDAIEAKLKEDEDLDREQALSRVRNQLAVFVGPMHRLWKIQGATIAQYTLVSGHGFDYLMRSANEKGRAFWMTMMADEFVTPFIKNPDSFEAVLYRNFVTRRLKPTYTKIRNLIENQLTDLADMPTQEEWLTRYNEEDIMSPYNGSLNINVIFDSYAVWTLEFDDIVESWADGDFRRMQPTTLIPFLICNDLIDILYENAKTKEAKYNKHVSVHKNTIQTNEVIRHP